MADRGFISEIIKFYILIKEKQLDIESTVDNFVTFFIAGQETTANTLAFCLLELGRNRDVLSK
jgi:cholesterol 24(S)-hydroxylase